MMEEKEELELLDSFRELLKDKKYADLRRLALDKQEADVAAIMEKMEDEDMLKMFRILPKELAADIFALLEDDSQQYIITSLSDREAGIIIDNLYADDAADLLEEMPASVVKRLLNNASAETRADINHLLQYPDDSAGSVMTVEFVDLNGFMTVSDAIKRVREKGTDSETVECLYVLNPKRILVGIVGLRSLILNNPETKISTIMDDDVISCYTNTDQEEVARMFQKYDLNTMPVVDKENRMVGIITVDDIIDILQEETTEDMEQMAGIIPGDKPYLRTGIFETWRKRIPWLLLLMISATFTGSIITSFEDALAKSIYLTAYIPMLMDTGGNAGSQTSTEVIRAIALGEAELSDFMRILWKEIRVGLLCGITLAAANFLKLILFDGRPLEVTTVVCLTIICAVFFAKTISCSLALVIKRVGLDPAVVASPMLTTVVDASSLLVYFAVASAFLGL